MINLDQWEAIYWVNFSPTARLTLAIFCRNNITPNCRFYLYALSRPPGIFTTQPRRNYRIRPV